MLTLNPKDVEEIGENPYEEERRILSARVRCAA
jgi:hypothetical protein